MADDDVRPGFEPTRHATARPQDGQRQTSAPPQVESESMAPPDAESIGSPAAAPHEADIEPAPGEEAALPLEAPSMASAGADLAATERAAESFAPRFEPVPPAPAQPRPLMPLLLAAIGLVLIVLLGINLYLIANPPGSSGLSDLQTQASALEQRVGVLERRPAADPRVAALDESVGKLAGGLDALSGSSKDLAGKIAALDTKTGALDSAIADVRQQVATLPKPDLGPVEAKIADVATGVAAVKAAVAALPTIDLAPINQSIAALDQRLAPINQSIDALDHRLTPINQSIDALDHRLAPIEAEFSAPKIAARVGEARQSGTAAETRAAPLAVTAQAIQQAIDEGRGFAPEFAALKTLGAGQADLAALEPVAAKGAPTKAALIAGFAAARDASTVAAAPVQSGTLFDRILANAQSTVKLRAVGAAPGDDADAILGRVAAALGHGDFNAALTEWNTLPEASKAASSAWAGQLKARVLAENAARSIATGAITVLGSTP